MESDRIEKILDEIAAYEIPLEEDPTLPHLGTAYLQRVLSQCRIYLNRVTFYYQELARDEKNLRVKLKVQEMDLDFKTKEKLADDTEVRKQPSISDREALAAVLLKQEHDAVSALKSELLNTEESLKIVKFKHSELLRTSADIRMQRALVKDDKDARLSGSDGYSSPQTSQDGTMADGLAPPITRQKIDPTDLLNPESRPDDLPEPVDAAHAKMIANFYGVFEQPSVKSAVIQPIESHKSEPATPSKPTDDPEASQVKSLSYDDLLS